jgi:hypothetical protein
MYIRTVAGLGMYSMDTVSTGTNKMIGGTVRLVVQATVYCSGAVCTVDSIVYVATCFLKPIVVVLCIGQNWIL